MLFVQDIKSIQFLWKTKLMQFEWKVYSNNSELVSVVLTEDSTYLNQLFDSPKVAHTRRIPSDPTIYTTSLSLDDFDFFYNLLYSIML